MTERWVKMVEKWHKKNPSATGLLTDDGAVKLLARQHRAFVRKVKKLDRIERVGKVNGCMVEFRSHVGAYVRLADLLAALAKQGGK